MWVQPLRLLCSVTLLLALFGLARTGLADPLAKALPHYYERQNWRFLNENFFLPEPVPALLEQTLAAGVPLREAAPDVALVINLPARELQVREGGQVIRHYPVTIGSRRYRTPLGPRALSQVIWNPWWHPPKADWAKDAKVTPPGPRNPLGKAKLPLGGEILLHGTNQPRSIGRALSHGCLRMFNEDVTELAWWMQRKFSDKNTKELFKKYQASWWNTTAVPLKHSIPVEIVYRRIEVQGDELRIHPDIYARSGAAWEELLETLSTIGIAPADIDPAQLPDELEVTESITLPIHEILTDIDESVV